MKKPLFLDVSRETLS